MKTLILQQRHLIYEKGREITIVDNKEAERLINTGVAVEKAIDMPSKDKMLRRIKNKSHSDSKER